MTDKELISNYEDTRQVSDELLNLAFNWEVTNTIKPAFANENISGITSKDKMFMRVLVHQKFQEIFDILKFDMKDPNIIQTPYRLAKMWVNEVMSGRFNPAPSITSFENINKYEGMCVVKAQVKSMCSHHFVPFLGTCYVGFIAEKDKKLIGLSKINRIVDWFCRRPQLQENLSDQIAKYLIEKLGVKNIAVYIKAEHFCVKWRGANDDLANMQSTVLYGVFKKAETRNEFLQYIGKDK